MSTFPSVLTTYTNPTPTSPLNAPSHSGVENAQNSGLVQLEATIGLTGASSTLGTVIGDLRSPASNGGGHVQSANTGGTGQISYNKGDILAASSSSVLGKIAIGADNTVLQADSTQTNGLKWANVVANKLQINTSSVLFAIRNSSIIGTLYSASVIGGIIGTNNAVKFTGEVRSMFSNSNADVLTLSLNYGNNTVAQAFINGNGASIMSGVIDGTVIGNGTIGSQIGWIRLDVGDTGGIPSPRLYGFSNGTSSVTSTVQQNITITAQYNNTATASILAGSFIVEKIQ